MPKDAFIDHWQQRHTQVVLGIKGLCRYVQNPGVPVAGLPPANFDGVVEVWFDDLETMRANGRSDYWPVVVVDGVCASLAGDFAVGPWLAVQERPIRA